MHDAGVESIAAASLANGANRLTNDLIIPPVLTATLAFDFLLQFSWETCQCDINPLNHNG